MKIEIVIDDDELAAAAQQQAGYEGRRDWKVMLQERAITGARALFGLRSDIAPKEAAIIMGCHLNTFWNYAKRGRFPGLYYTSSGRALVPMAEVMALRNRTRAVEPPNKTACAA